MATPFIAAPAYQGSKSQYVFKLGSQGVGYYLDAGGREAEHAHTNGGSRPTESRKRPRPDEEADEDRIIKPEWLVLVGICTHLGCVPMGKQNLFSNASKLPLSNFS